MANPGKLGREGEQLVVAGRVRRAWGIKGGLAVEWNNGVCPVAPGSGEIFLSQQGDKDPKVFVVSEDHQRSGYHLLMIKGMNDKSCADKFRGSLIWIRERDLAVLTEGEYYCYQLLGMKVVTISGEELGSIETIFSAGENEVCVVRGGQKEVLIPLISEVIKKVDVAAGIVEVELWEGMI